MTTTTDDGIKAGSQSSTNTPAQSVDPNRRKHPCVLCQQRKVKCDRDEPCGNCSKAHVPCVSSAMLPPKRRKKRFPEAELLAKLRRYEEHLRRYGADIDAINNETQPMHVAPPKNNDNPWVEVPAPQAHPRADAIRSLAIRRSLKNVKNNLYEGVSEKFREVEDILQGSSDDETLEIPITKTYDAIDADGSDFLFPTPSSDSISDLHPSTVHIFRLWQLFIDNVNPIIKIFHAPSVQVQILEASADLENVPREIEALLFGIYAMAVTSITDSECNTMFGEEKTVLLARYQSGSRQALCRAGLLRSSDMTILQAFVLYLISCLNFSIDPRSHFCLTGIAMRIAQRMGLNYDGTTYGLAPFETEMRRRLWYQIIFLDKRVAELSGAGFSASNYEWATKPPLNVNDSDLFPDMKETPLESKGVTEMIYVLQRCETANLMQVLRNGSVGVTLEEKDRAVEQLQQRFAERYQQFCDPSVPLHLLSTFMSHTSTAKLAMGPRFPLTVANTSSLSSTEKDKLFHLSLRMMEAHNSMLGSPSLKRFLWHVCTNFPFPAHVYLLCALRQTTTGPLANRAWVAFGEHYNNLRIAGRLNTMAKHRESAIHLAIANLTIKAWDVRERDNPGIEVPKFVMHMRCRLGGGSALCPKGSKSCFVSPGDQPPAEEHADPTAGTQIPVMGLPSSEAGHAVSGVQEVLDPIPWLSGQPGQYDIAAMGLGFDDTMMQGLVPTFNENTASMSWDIWGDYQPEVHSTEDSMPSGMMAFHATADTQGHIFSHTFR